MTEKSRDKLYRCLTGLWCIDQENRWDFSSCELMRCIKDIDQKLRKALVTRKAVDSEKSKIGGKGKAKIKKNYPENPEMVEAPDLFKKYLNINCLTQDQLDVFKCKERFLWVDGPAGSGKTVVMLGKIIDIVLNNDTESVLIMSFGWKTLPAVLRYHEVLDNIREDISCTIVEYNSIEEGDIADKVTAAEGSLKKQLSTCNSRIVVLVSNATVISSLMYDIITSRFNYVFVDDYQRLFDGLVSKRFQEHYTYRSNIMSEVLLRLVENCSTNNTNLWVFCDNAQSLLIGIFNKLRVQAIALADYVLDIAEKFKKIFIHQKVLSVNLRNTHEISSVLSVIRKHYDAMEFTAAGTLVFPQQKNGHFLRGTKPTIYLLRDDDPASCIGILEKELLKVRRPDSSLDDKDIALLLESCDEDSAELLGTVFRVQGKLNMRITVQYTFDCMSAEWPAVVYIQKYWTMRDKSTGQRETKFSDIIPFLYNALSRARVYSTVIIYNYTPNTCKYTDNLLSELRKRRDICRIIE